MLSRGGWPNALDISLNMLVERCIVKSRARLARALYPIDIPILGYKKIEKFIKVGHDSPTSKLSKLCSTEGCADNWGKSRPICL